MTQRTVEEAQAPSGGRTVDDDSNREAMMPCLVAYFESFPLPVRRLLHHHFGMDHIDPAAPVVSGAFPTESSARAARDTFLHSARLGEDDDRVMVQPDESDVPTMLQDEALALVQSVPSSRERVAGDTAEGAHPHFHAREYPRCWLVVVEVWPGAIPPGVAYVVDKWSRRVFERRWADCALHMFPEEPEQEMEME